MPPVDPPRKPVPISESYGLTKTEVIVYVLLAVILPVAYWVWG